MPFDDSKWRELVSQWEEDEPGVEDIDTPPVPAVEPEGEMVLPELDLSGGEPIEDSPTEGGEAPQTPQKPLDAGGPAKLPEVGRPGAALSDPSRLDWKAMGDRLALAEAGRGQSKAYEGMFANIGAQSGYRPNAHAGEAALNIAKQPLGLAKERQDMESRELSMQSQRDAQGVKVAMDDPNSLQSQKAREVVKAMAGDIKLPSGFDNWSANDVRRFTSGGALTRMSADRRAADAAKVKAEGAAQKAAAAETDLQNARKNWANELKDAGVDPTTATREDIKLAMSRRHAAATEKVAASNLAIANSNRRDKDEDRAALRETIPFGSGELRYTGKGTPREDDRKKAQDTAAGWNAALTGMNDLEGSLKAFATSPGVDTKRDVESKVRVVSAALNSAIGGGAMSESEALAMAKALGADVVSPSGIEAALRHLVGDDPKAAQVLLTRLNSVRQSAISTARGKLKSYRYEMEGGETPEIPPEETREINGTTYRKKNGKWVTGG